MDSASVEGFTFAISACLVGRSRHAGRDKTNKSEEIKIL